MKVITKNAVLVKDVPSIGGQPFGTSFTSNMVVASFSNGEWGDFEIKKFENINIHPASTILHYGASVFEGLKAYLVNNSCINLFRPLDNLNRLNYSAKRLCLPTIDKALFLEVLTKFVSIEAAWVPKKEGASLYLRPVIFGVDENLGLNPVENAAFLLIASPVESYYSGGLSPVSIMVELNDVRAVKGGTGDIKCGGNYAASLRATKNAKERGFDQVLWLDAKERRYIEEVGAMNIFFRLGSEIVTPKLSGTILPGITRDSSIALLSKSHKVVERDIDIAEISSADEAFGVGTAAVVSPVGKIAYGGAEVEFKNFSTATALYRSLTDIQYGRAKDEFNWVHRVEVQK